MRHDPAGHYAALGVDRHASVAAINTAFRAAARRFHPDVPGTGDARAFIRAKDAYDVISDPRRRAAYDRLGQPLARDAIELVVPAAPVETVPSAAEAMAEGWRRSSPVTLGLGAGFAGLAVVALAIGLSRLPLSRLAVSGVPPTTEMVRSPAALPTVTPMPAPRDPAPPPLPIGRLASGYVLPAGGPATLWHRRPASVSGFVPVGELAAFTAVAIRQADRQHGMVEIGLADGASAFIDADRLAPGDAAAAERARCIYDAGVPPANNQVLGRRGGGPARVEVENRRDQPAVVKLRDVAGSAAAAVFVAPRQSVRVDDLPAGVYRLEFAFGELWSHACHRFVAGMRAQRFTTFIRLDPTLQGETRTAIPPEAAIDEPDHEFNRE